jgi:hypothetical protein
MDSGNAIHMLKVLFLAKEKSTLTEEKLKKGFSKK